MVVGASSNLEHSILKSRSIGTMAKDILFAETNLCHNIQW